MITNYKLNQATKGLFVNEPKRHHYVPRMYLKRFSPTYADDGSELAFVFLTKNNCNIGLRSYKDQCQLRKFYDIDTERYLATKETEWNDAIQNAVEEKSLADDDVFKLREFLVYQLNRTPAWLSSTKAIVRNLIVLCENHASDENVGQALARYWEEISKELSPETFIEESEHINRKVEDLEIAVVCNRTKVELITSDTPVLYFNMLAWGIDRCDSIGIMFVCPLDTQHLLIMYDAGVYDIKTNDDGYIDLCNEDEVRLFNCYQYLMSDHILISKSEFSLDEYPSEITDIKCQVQQRRLHQSVKVDEILDELYNEIPRIARLFDSQRVYTMKRSFRKVPIQYGTTFPRNKPIAGCDTESEIRDSIVDGKSLKKTSLSVGKDYKHLLSSEEKKALKLLGKAFAFYWNIEF